MRITVNGEHRDIADGTTVLSLLEGLGLSPSAMVVEHNGEVLDRNAFAAKTLAAGDRLELVRIVGGG